MSSVSKYKVLSQAKESFTKAEYDRALSKFAEVLHNYPNSKEAFNGAILSEMALSGEDGAEALFDYYEVLKEEDKEQADILMSEILESMDSSLERLSEIFSEPLKERLEFEDGILYSDFRELIEKNGNFKEVFENIMFSTRVIITQKDDFIDFLDNLIENGFTEMALTYLENALNIYPTEKVLRTLLKKLIKGETIEN